MNSERGDQTLVVQQSPASSPSRLILTANFLLTEAFFLRMITLSGVHKHSAQTRSARVDLSVAKGASMVVIGGSGTEGC
jgi:hypothetical protein